MIVQDAHDDDDLWKFAALMLGRSTGLGYTDKLVHEVYSGVIVDCRNSRSWGLCFRQLRHHERSAILQSILKDVQKLYFAIDEKSIPTAGSTVGGVAALLNEILRDTASPQETLRSWLSNPGTNVVTTFGLRRALVLLVAKDPGKSIPILQDLILTPYRLSTATTGAGFPRLWG